MNVEIGFKVLFVGQRRFRRSLFVDLVDRSFFFRTTYEQEEKLSRGTKINKMLAVGEDLKRRFFIRKETDIKAVSISKRAASSRIRRIRCVLWPKTSVSATYLFHVHSSTMTPTRKILRFLYSRVSLDFTFHLIRPFQC